MSTEKGPDEILPQHSVQEITAILIKHHDIHEGQYELSFEINIAVGAFALSEHGPLPGAAVTFSKLGIKRVEGKPPNSVDAAEVNPAKTRPVREKAKK